MQGELTEDDFGETERNPDILWGNTFWAYLCYVREHPVTWTVPTHILYGEKGITLTSYETIAEFADRIEQQLTVMENGEHWFHTKEQMDSF